MSDVIFNEDGSVYMTFGPVQERKAEFTIRWVTGQDNGATVDSYDCSMNQVCRIRSHLTEVYGKGPVAVTTIGPRNEWGVHTAYRYSWERLTSWGGRMVDTLWITRIGS